MHKGKLVFAQLNEHLPKPIFRDCVKRYAGRYPTLSFSHWDQLLCMMFAQLPDGQSKFPHPRPPQIPPGSAARL